MLIEFIKPDPRAGCTALMDSSRGQQLIDAGSAVRISEAGEPIASAPAPTATLAPAPAPAPAPDLTEAQKFVDGTVEDVKSRIEGAEKEALQAALEAEKAKEDKARKGVTDALTAAIAALEPKS